VHLLIGGILLLAIGYFLIGVVRRNFFPLLFLSIAVWVAFAYTSYFLWTLGIGFVLLLVIAYMIQLRNFRNIRLECEPLLRKKRLELLAKKFIEYDQEHKKLFLKEYGKKFSTYSIDGDDFLRHLLGLDIMSFSEAKMNNKKDAAIFEKEEGEEYLGKAWGFMDGWGMDKAIEVLNCCGIRATEQSIIDQKKKVPVVLINIRLTEEGGDCDPLISCGEVIDLD